jgi:hypothetical protein
MKLSLYFNWAPRHEGVLTEWRYSSTHILGLGTRRRWVVIFMSRPLYSQRKSPWYPLDRRLGGPQSRWWREKFPAPSGNRTPIIQPAVQRYSIELPGFYIKMGVKRYGIWDFGLNSTVSSWGPVPGSYIHGNDPLGPFKKRAISSPAGRLPNLKDFTPWS